MKRLKQFFCSHKRVSLGSIATEYYDGRWSNDQIFVCSKCKKYKEMEGVKKISGL